MNNRFSINKDTQGASIVPIPAPKKLTAPSDIYTTGYMFPICTLIAVKFIPNKAITRNGVEEEVPVLMFLFEDNKKRQFQHIEFPIDDDDAKAEKKSEWFISRVKHIWDETIGADKFPEEGINGDDIPSFYKGVADAFNSIKVPINGKEKCLYAVRPVYLKLTYNKDRLNLPLFPNFIQVAMRGDKQVPVTYLTINPARDNVEPKVAASPAVGGFTSGTDASFGATNINDYPDVL